MKIITWNCCEQICAKYKYIDHFDSDLIVIQEAGKDQRIREYRFAHWEGLTDSKGIGLYSKTDIQIIEDNKINKYNKIRLDEFIPFRTNNQLFIAVWTKGNSKSVLDYIGQLFFYLEMNPNFLTQKPIILGDLNSNTKWDEYKYDAWWKHSDLVNILANYNIHSVYHQLRDIAHGEEKEYTSYHMYNKEKPNHIDYIFAPNEMIEKTKDFKIVPWDEIMDEKANKYVSDHCPIYWEYEECPTTAST